MTVEGGTDTAVFATYPQRVLLPALPGGTVLVVDNVGAHKPDRIRQLVAAAGCELVFLPAYSPGLSPIEEAFSKIKALVKAAAARSRAALDAAIAAALHAVTAADVTGWFPRRPTHPASCLTAVVRRPAVRRPPPLWRAAQARGKVGMTSRLAVEWKTPAKDVDPSAVLDDS